MCGIVGVISNSRFPEANFHRALRSIKHRGPDDEGIFESEGVKLGMTRLSIIDIERGKQPSFSPDRKLVTLFNGEIYNFRELRINMETLGHSFSTQSESEVITHLFMEYGSNFVKKLNGMFAIAIWNESTRSLHLFRDRVGKKPLWFSTNKNNFCFASEIKAMLELGIPKNIRKGLIEDTLKYGYSNAPYSPFDNMFQLRPGSALTYHDGETEIEEYWSPLEQDVTEIHESQALEDFNFLFRDSVCKRMNSERPLGVFLSGGIDSSLVTAFASTLSPTKLETFSIGFSEREFDESRYASDVSKILGTNHHELIVRPNSNLVLEDLRDILDQPFADSSIIPTILLSRFAREYCVVALGGDGGDEVFGGYNRYRFLNQIHQLLHIIPNIAQKIFSRIDLPDKHQRVIRAVTSENLEQSYDSLMSLIPQSAIKKLINKDFYAENTKFSDSIIWNNTEFSLLKKMQLSDIRSYLPGDLLYKADIASMSASLELRSPFLDYRLIEFGLRLPDNMKIRNGKSKWLLKESLRSFLPDGLVDRPKMGFGIPRAAWLREPLNEVLREMLLSERTKGRGWFNVSEIRKIVEQHEKGANRDSFLWPLLILELWARKYLD